MCLLARLLVCLLFCVDTDIDIDIDCICWCQSYRSFTRVSNNIGDLTAKGEAQIAVIDLLGMAFGLIISRFVGLSTSSSAGLQRVVVSYLLLSVAEMVCAYQEIKR